MCNERASMPSVTRSSRRVKDVLWETGVTQETEILAPLARCVSVLLGGVDNPFAGVMEINLSRRSGGWTSRQSGINGVVAREDMALICLWKGV